MRVIARVSMWTMVAQRALPPHPRRFMAAPQRNRRLGRPLRLLTRTMRPDHQLIELIGQRLMQRDEVGAALVSAMRITDADDPDRVTMGQFKTALEYGADAVPDCPRALREFFAEVERVPHWVDMRADQRRCGGVPTAWAATPPM